MVRAAGVFAARWAGSLVTFCSYLLALPHALPVAHTNAASFDGPSSAQPLRFAVSLLYWRCCRATLQRRGIPYESGRKLSRMNAWRRRAVIACLFSKRSLFGGALLTNMATHLIGQPSGRVIRWRVRGSAPLSSGAFIFCSAFLAAMARPVRPMCGGWSAVKK